MKPYRPHLLAFLLLLIAAYLMIPHTPSEVVGPNPLLGFLVLAPALWVLRVIFRREA